MDLSEIRSEYSQKTLSKESVDSNPLIQLEQWVKEAREASCMEPTAMTLATSSESGQPSLRTVLLKYLKPDGLYFFTNYESRKGSEISQNPKVALLFFWPELERQVKIEGIARLAAPEISDYYFNSRPLESRISALISRQSTEMPDRETLEAYWQSEAQKWENKPIERPYFWGGYQVKPHRIEFWQGRAYRLHDRIAYKICTDGWKIIRLSP